MNVHVWPLSAFGYIIVLTWHLRLSVFSFFILLEINFLSNMSLLISLPLTLSIHNKQHNNSSDHRGFRPEKYPRNLISFHSPRLIYMVTSCLSLVSFSLVSDPPLFLLLLYLLLLSFYFLHTLPKRDMMFHFLHFWGLPPSVVVCLLWIDKVRR